MTKYNCENKVTILVSTLVTVFRQNMNLARVEFFGLLITALCKLQTVGFEKLAVSIDPQATRNSSLRRGQRFMAGYLLDINLILNCYLQLSFERRR